MTLMRNGRKGPRPGQSGYQEVRSSTVQVLGWMHERRHPRSLWSPPRTAILIQPLACNPRSEAKNRRCDSHLLLNQYRAHPKGHVYMVAIKV